MVSVETKNGDLDENGFIFLIFSPKILIAFTPVFTTIWIVNCIVRCELDFELVSICEQL